MMRDNERVKRWSVTAVAFVACAGAAMATARPDGATIVSSGSTNFPGYTIKVHSDGSAWAARSNKQGEQMGAAVTARLPARVAQKLLNDAKAAKLSGNVIGQPCMKSASFGSTLVVQYHGWTSPDLNCPGGGFVIALGADANKIAALLPVAKGPVRRPMLPNEPRRPEPAPSQASPTPESSPALP